MILRMYNILNSSILQCIVLDVYFVFIVYYLEVYRDGTDSLWISWKDSGYDFLKSTLRSLGFWVVGSEGNWVVD